jgi:AraC family transcriptional regulator
MPWLEAIPPQSRSIRLTHYAARSNMAAHHHDLPSLSIVVSGLYEERVRGRVSEHGPGNLLFHPAFELHSQRFRAAGVSQILITPTQADLEFLGQHLRLGEAPYIQSDALRDLSGRLIAEMRSADTFSQMVVHGLTLEALGLFCRTASRARTTILPWLRELRALIDSNFGAPLTLDELALEVGRHPVHLSRAFRRAYGQTIGECIRKARVRNAAHLLLSSRRPISEIATECGFCDQAHLSRAFKRIFGLTPAAYRLAAR